MPRVARLQLVLAGVLVAALVVGLVVSRLRPGPEQSGPAKAAVGTQPADPDRSGPTGEGDPRQDRSPGGARTTALAYAAGVQQEVVYLSDADLRSLMAEWMAPGVDPGEMGRTAAGFEETRKALLATGGQAWWVVSPLAAKAGPFTPDRAQVAVWLAWVLASGDESGGYVPTSGWLTATVELVWADGPGWSVWSVSSTPGPVPGPKASDRPATSDEFITALQGFSLVKDHR